jgi:type II secretory pathway predicted ATPase ExeA
MDYRDYFNLKTAPFHLTPDPAFYFPSNAHREALQTLLYSIRAGEGFVQITGDPGTGKTLLIRTILKELGEGISTALIFNPRLSPHELLRTLLEDLGLDPSMIENLPREDLLRRFRDFLLSKAEQGERVIVIIDEAQNLPLDTLEELRLLSNLETEKEKLLQIILVGQRELEQRLNLPEVQQLHQRITIRYQLQYLSQEDIQSYIYHRLQVATPEDKKVTVKFTSKAINAIYRYSKGTPRLINIICERSLMAAYVEGEKTIRVDKVKKALDSIRGNDEQSSRKSFLKNYLPAAALLLILVWLGSFSVWLYKPSVYELGILQKMQPVFEDMQNVLPWTRVDGNGDSGPETAQLKEKEQTLKAAVNATLKKQAKKTVKSEQRTAVVRKEQQEPKEQKAANATKQAPEEAFFVSRQAFFVRVLTDSDRVQVWKGTAEEPRLLKSIEYDWPYGQGLYIAGHDPKQGSYIFNHSAFLRGNPTTRSSTFFALIRPLIQGNAVPVMATDTENEVGSKELQRAAQVREVFNSFLNSWESMRINRLFQLYSDLITSHYLDQPKPIVLSKEQSYERKKDVFNRSSYINLGVSRPLFLLNPQDPENVIAVYHQKYRSKTWDDNGTKVLYFSLQDSKAGQKWKIVAELWVRDIPKQ